MDEQTRQALVNANRAGDLMVGQSFDLPFTPDVSQKTIGYTERFPTRVRQERGNPGRIEIKRTKDGLWYRVSAVE